MTLPFKQQTPPKPREGALRFLSEPAPTHTFPRTEIDPAAAYQLVHDETLLDGNSRQNLATFCQTWVEPQLRQLMDECLGKNMIDKDEYPQMAEIESRCVRMLADLWNCPDPANTVGCSTSGSSEAVMLGGLAMKQRWRMKRRGLAEGAASPNWVVGQFMFAGQSLRTTLTWNFGKYLARLAA